PEAVKATEFVKNPEFDNFCSIHGLLEDTLKAKYVKEIADATSSTKEKIINHAISNPERFLTAFDQWKKENAVKKDKKVEREEIHSMDELFEAQKDIYI